MTPKRIAKVRKKSQIIGMGIEFDWFDGFANLSIRVVNIV